MDIRKLKQENPVLLDYMKQQGYGKVSIGGVQVRLKELFEQEGNYASYGDFYEKLLKRKGISKGDERSKYYRLSIRRIEAFDEYGHLPNRFAFIPTLQQKSSMNQLEGLFKTIIEHYKEVSLQTGKASSSIIVESNYAAAFFAYMQSKGAYTLADVTEPLILSYFYDRGRQLRGYTCQKSIIRVLRSSKGLLCQKECKYLCDIMPPLKNIRKNFAILSDDETAIIASTLENDNSNLTLRDKAVISIAMYTGLRGSDIAKMTVDTIDFERDLITLEQSKTHQKLVLPLRAVVGNVVMEYLKKERPKEVNIQRLFTHLYDPEKPISPGVIGKIARRFFNKLGIRKGECQNGIRLFRRYLATKLLRNGVTPRYISEIMGHISPESLNPYIDADIVHLRECGIDISKYPVREEVFDV